MAEIFQQVLNYPKYEISNCGTIKNYTTKRILKTTVSPRGYSFIKLSNDVNSKNCCIHKLVAECFLENPDNKPQVDHIDGNKLNNNISNLRFVTRSENGMNRLKAKNNNSGYTGICYDKSHKQFHAQLWIKGKRIHLGYYDLLEDAVISRKNAQDKYFGEFQKN